MSDSKDKLNMLHQGQTVLQDHLPGVMNSFRGFAQSVLQEGNLSKKEKELIAVAVSVAIHCET